MKHMTLKSIAAAVALAGMSAVSNAQTVGNTSAGASLVDVGPANVTGHGPAGAPGISVHGANQYISLQSIEPFTGFGTVTSDTHTFNRYQLLAGFQHPNPQPGDPLTVDANGVKIPGLAENVYFGLISYGTSAPYQQQSFYVGDQTNFTKPSTNTTYDAVGMLGNASTPGSTPIILTGKLQYSSTSDTLATSSATNHLSDGGANQLRFTSSAISTNNPFTGSSSYWVSGVQVGTGNLEARFFGGTGTDPSAVAGIAHGTSGTAYEASFGGVKH